MKAPLMLKLAILTLLIIFSAGCASPIVIGTKIDREIVYCKLGRFNDEFKGLIKIATNKPIPVTVNGKPAKMDLGGFIPVHEEDLKAIKNRSN